VAGFRRPARPGRRHRPAAQPRCRCPSASRRQGGLDSSTLLSPDAGQIRTGGGPGAQRANSASIRAVDPAAGRPPKSACGSGKHTRWPASAVQRGPDAGTGALRNLDADARRPPAGKAGSIRPPCSLRTRAKSGRAAGPARSGPTPLRSVRRIRRPAARRVKSACGSGKHTRWPTSAVQRGPDAGTGALHNLDADARRPPAGKAGSIRPHGLPPRRPSGAPRISRRNCRVF
jgi:hypothetical protein